MQYGYTMVKENLAICPVVIDEGWQVVGIEGQHLHVTNGDGERRIETPFYQGGACFCEKFRVEAGDGEYEDLFMLIPSSQGNMVCEVSVDKDKGVNFLVAKLVPRTN